jgi:ComF family protein
MSSLTNLMNYFHDKVQQFLPSQPCLLCGANSADETWCQICDASLPYLNLNLCPICALPTLHAEICGRCLQNPPHFIRTISTFAYTFPLNKLILSLKYGEKFQLAPIFAKRLAQRISVLPDCIISMPLHPTRLKERGFNQSYQIAYAIGQQLNIPVLPSSCIRLRNTPSQSTMPWKERGKNVRKAFACSTQVAGKHIAIVDDVMTTGSTLNELAMVLKEAGAIEVSAWVVARTLPHDDN